MLALLNVESEAKGMFLFGLVFVASAALLYFLVRQWIAWAKVPHHVARMRELMEQQAERDKLRQ